MTIISLLLALLFCKSSVNASSPENEASQTSARRYDSLSAWRYQSCGEYYLNKTNLEADDIVSILKLLEVNPKFNSSKPTEIVNDDFYSLKAYFEYDPSNYSNKKLEVISSIKQFIAQGQHAFITGFRIANGTLGEQFYLTLTIIDKQASPHYEISERNIKILHKSIQLSESPPQEEISELDNQSSPLARKKRSFSLSKLKGALSPKSDSSRNLKSPRSPRKEKGKAKVITTDSTKFYSPILVRLRSATSPHQVTTAKEPDSPPAAKPIKPITKSLSFRLKNHHDIRKSSGDSIVSSPPQSLGKSWFSRKPHRSKSYPAIKSSFKVNDITPLSSPFAPRTVTVKEKVEAYEVLTKKISQEK